MLHGQFFVYCPGLVGKHKCGHFVWYERARAHCEDCNDVFCVDCIAKCDEDGSVPLVCVRGVRICRAGSPQSRLQFHLRTCTRTRTSTTTSLSPPPEAPAIYVATILCLYRSIAIFDCKCGVVVAINSTWVDTICNNYHVTFDKQAQGDHQRDTSQTCISARFGAQAREVLVRKATELRDYFHGAPSMQCESLEDGKFSDLFMRSNMSPNPT